MNRKDRFYYTSLREDLFQLLADLSKGRRSGYFCIRVGKLRKLFLDRYMFKYYQDGRNMVSDEDLSDMMRFMRVCSKFKFRTKRPKRYKIICHKLARCLEVYNVRPKMEQ